MLQSRLLEMVSITCLYPSPSDCVGKDLLTSWVARFLILAASASLASCTAIGPTLQVAPGLGKSPAEFADDRASCGRGTDEQLQPVATKLSIAATSSQQVAANNQWLQQAYNATFAKCMASRGNIVPTAAQPSIASASLVAPQRVDNGSGGTLAPGHLKGGWQFFDVSYHTAGGQPRDVNDALWPREIAHPPSGPGTSLAIYSVLLDDGPRSVMVSVASQGFEHCDNGPNDVNSTRDYAVCPGKLAILADGRLTKIRSAGPLCVEAINDGGVQEGAPDWKDPRRWGTRARYNASSGTLELMTMQGGRVEAACSKTISVR